MGTVADTNDEIKKNDEDFKKEEELKASKEYAMKVLGDQQHLLNRSATMSVEQMDDMLAQLKALKVLDFKEYLNEAKRSKVNPVKLRPIDDEHYTATRTMTDLEKNVCWRKGLYAISRGEVAVVAMAGGQGTRLGSSLPKAVMPLGFGLTKEAKLNSLLCMQAARICRLQYLARREYPHHANGCIRWVIMTSAATHKEVVDHVQHVVLPKYGNPKRGISPDRIMYVVQGEAPCFDMEGKLLLTNKFRIASSPDGNGGLLDALAPRVSELAISGVKYLHVYCVDNVLCRVADPFFIGLCISKNADCAAKVVEKIVPDEPLGVICYEGSTPRVIEYSELPSDLASARNKSRRLLFRAGNIANHVFSIGFLKRVINAKLPYHLALKKIAYVDEKGRYVRPQEPNGYKLEKFIFDVFPYAKNFQVYEVLREREFSPLKNSEEVGRDCLSTCWRDYQKECRQMLRCAGAIVPEEHGLVYIAPRVSYIGEGLEEFKHHTIGLPFFKDENDLKERE